MGKDVTQNLNPYERSQHKRKRGVTWHLQRQWPFACLPSLKLVEVIRLLQVEQRARALRADELAADVGVRPCSRRRENPARLGSARLDHMHRNDSDTIGRVLGSTVMHERASRDGSRCGCARVGRRCVVVVCPRMPAYLTSPVVTEI